MAYTPEKSEKAERYDKADPVEKPVEKPEKKELSKAEKDQILREAVSFYLRNDFRDAEIREVCEEFIAGVDKAARATVESGTAPAAAHPQQHNRKP